MKVNIIGAGALGKNLAFALQKKSIAEIGSICNQSIVSACQAVNAIGFGTPVPTLTDLSPADITFITCSDDNISIVADLLAETNIISIDSYVIHCSGVLDTQVLQSLKKRNCSIASIHPLKAFRSLPLNEEVFKGCYCVVEGDELAIRMLKTLFTDLGAVIVSIDSTKKSIYHSAAVMASNYLVTLAASATTLLQQAGIDDDLACSMVCQLMDSSMSNIKRSQQFTDALTGPLRRGDISTIHKHLNAIQDPLINDFYCVAALATLPLTSHNQETLRALKCLLTVDDKSS
ncbi:MAG: Rossmann-like and DUF2520 domain-containing protein [Legionella sp.]